jgi:hypothetical protein
MAFKSVSQPIYFQEAADAFAWLTLLVNSATPETVQAVYEDCGTDLSAVVYYYREFKKGGAV